MISEEKNYPSKKNCVNFDTSESDENWYKGVLDHAGNESGLSFVIM